VLEPALKCGVDLPGRVRVGDEVRLVDGAA
jgi:hypothetical protein